MERLGESEMAGRSAGNSHAVRQFARQKRGLRL